MRGMGGACGDQKTGAKKPVRRIGPYLRSFRQQHPFTQR